MNMKIGLLKALVAVCDNDLNVTLAARRQNTVQPSISKKIFQLEEIVGQRLFTRRGKRFTGMTPLCHLMLSEARDILLKCENISTMGEVKLDGNTAGVLRIGTTHTQARYVLPPAVTIFHRRYPNIFLQLFQGSPAQLVRQLENNETDLVICTEALEDNPSCRSVDAYSWNRILIMPRHHSLAAVRRPTLRQLAKYPLVTYVTGFTGRGVFDDTFRKKKVSPNVVVSAADADVIKTYVRLGLGIGIIAAVAFERQDGDDLAAVSLAHLFPQMTVRIAYHKEKFVTEAMRQFIDIFQSLHKTETPAMPEPRRRKTAKSGR